MVKRQVVAATLILLAITTNVYAECAWILWEKRQINDLESKNAESENLSWSAKTGIPNLLSCFKAVE